MNSTNSTQPFRFPYRGTLYSIAPHWVLPNRHLVLPNGTVLVVGEWSGRVPVALADIRQAREGMPVQDIVRQLHGVLAEESAPALGETLEPMAVLDFQDMRYAVPIEGIWGSKAIELPDGQLVTSHSFTEERPTRIMRVNVLDRAGIEATTILSQLGVVHARAMSLDYPGMPPEPQDLRIRFSYQQEAYILSEEAYEQRLPILYIPDCGYFQIGIYLQTRPVQLDRLVPLPQYHGDARNVAVALRLADAVDTEPSYGHTEGVPQKDSLHDRTLL